MMPSCLSEYPRAVKFSPRNRAIITNARVAATLPSLSDYFWQFTDGRVVVYDGHPDGHIPAQNGLSRRVAASLRQLGMTFVGPVNIYAHLQACGIICDHSRSCPRFQQIIDTFPTVFLPADDER